MELSTATTPSEELNARIQSYLAERQALIEKEKQLRHDYPFRQRLTPIAHKASQIVSRIRQYEALTVWAAEENGANGIFPGMSFTLAKERMESTQLWRIVKKMPKGCLLHCHFEAMVDVGWLLNLALNTDGMGIYSESGPILKTKDLETVSIRFRFSPDLLGAQASSNWEGPNLYNKDYVSGTLIPIKKAAETFPPNLLPSSPSSEGGCPSFLKWLTTRTTITPQESLLLYEGPRKIWSKFQSTFLIMSGIIYYEPNYRKLIAHMIQSLHSDNTSWVDVRLAFHMQLLESHTGKLLSTLDVVRIFAEEVENYKLTSFNADKSFWGARIIWTTIRSCSAEEIMENMTLCIEAKTHYPSTIAGYDLVGQEDLGRPLLSFLPQLLWFKQTCLDKNLHIPLFLHAGETLGDGTPHDSNLFDALLLLENNRRIGHGFSLYKHPYLVTLAVQKNICLEVCPISNEVLRLTSSILTHPLPAFLANGVAVSLNNDDPGVLGQNATGSLTHDYWQVVQAFDNVGLEGLGDLAETGVRFAAFCGEGGVEKEKDEDDMGTDGREGGVRRRHMNEWRGRWEEFCEWVINEFGAQWLAT